MQALRLLSPASDKVLHLRCKDEWRSVPGVLNKDLFSWPCLTSLLLWLFAHLPFKASKLLRVAHNLAKVDVKHVSTVLQHDVVVVAVADPQDEGGHAPACTGVDEVHHSLQKGKLFMFIPHHLFMRHWVSLYWRERGSMPLTQILMSCH